MIATQSNIRIDVVASTGTYFINRKIGRKGKRHVTCDRHVKPLSLYLVGIVSINFTYIHFVFGFVFHFLRGWKSIKGNICSIDTLHWVCVQCTARRRCANHRADSNFKPRIKHRTGWIIPIQVGKMGPKCQTKTTKNENFSVKCVCFEAHQTEPNTQTEAVTNG